MEDSKIQRSLEHYFLPRHEYQKDKNELFAHFNKKIDENKDRINEIDDKHTENFHKLQRSLDNYSSNVGALNESVKSLNETMTNMADSINKDREDMRNITIRVNETEKVITQTQLVKEQRKAEFLKFASIVISGLLGAGGLISWIGPLLFSGK